MDFTPVPGTTVNGSARQQQARSSHSVSKVVTHISKLQRQNECLAQQLKVGATATRSIGHLTPAFHTDVYLLISSNDVSVLFYQKALSEHA